MSFLDRVWKIVVFPAREWPAVARESTTFERLFLTYAAPLAALGPICGLVRISILGIPTSRGLYRIPILSGVVEAVLSLLLALLGVYVLAHVVNVLVAPFGGEPDFEQSLKLVTYSYTPIWLAGLLLLLPQIGLLRIVALAISIYAAFLIYLGLPPLLKVPKDRAAGFAILIAFAAVLLGIIFDFGVRALRLGLGLHG